MLSLLTTTSRMCFWNCDKQWPCHFVKHICGMPLNWSTWILVCGRNDMLRKLIFGLWHIYFQIDWSGIIAAIKFREFTSDFNPTRLQRNLQTYFDIWTFDRWCWFGELAFRNICRTVFNETHSGLGHSINANYENSQLFIDNPRFFFYL